MNVIKRYWDSVYVYVLLLMPGFCACAGINWTICKLMGLYEHLSWAKIILFDCTQLFYFTVAIYFICRNRKDSSYIPEHLGYVKAFITVALFIQYNAIMYLFASVQVWICTFLFFAIIAFLFDTKLMLLNIIAYAISLLSAHMIRPEKFLPLDAPNVVEIISYRILIFVLTSFCIMVIVYFVERFLIQVQESDEENMHLMEKQLKYYKDMELLDTELRKFRHDIRNHFICMESLFQNGKTEELQRYFEELQEDFSTGKNMFFSGNDIIDAILHHDLPYYCKENVKVSVYGKLPEIETVSAMDLCTLFSNLLSNAIASANDCAEKESQLSIQFSGGSKYFSIVMSNSVLKRVDEKLKKKQDRNHGFGTRKIQGVVQKYDGRLEVTVEEQIVKIEVYLPI